MADAKAKARDALALGDAPSAKPPAKKSKISTLGPMDAFLSAQRQISDAACNFVLQNAPSTEPQGYKYLSDDAAELKEQLDDAYKNNDFDTVEKVQPQYDTAVSRSLFEQKLFTSALAAHDYAMTKLDDAKRKRQVDRCKYYFSVIKTCEEYIAKVPDEDKIIDTVVTGAFFPWSLLPVQLHACSCESITNTLFPRYHHHTPPSHCR